MKRSALEFRRLHNIRDDECGECAPKSSDLAETSNPRYQKGITVSHTRGQQRMRRWVRYK